MKKNTFPIYPKKKFCFLPSRFRFSARRNFFTLISKRRKGRRGKKRQNFYPPRTHKGKNFYFISLNTQHAPNRQRTPNKLPTLSSHFANHRWWLGTSSHGTHPNRCPPPGPLTALAGPARGPERTSSSCHQRLPCPESGSASPPPPTKQKNPLRVQALFHPSTETHRHVRPKKKMNHQLERFKKKDVGNRTRGERKKLSSSPPPFPSSAPFAGQLLLETPPFLPPSSLLLLSPRFSCPPSFFHARPFPRSRALVVVRGGGEGRARGEGTFYGLFATFLRLSSVFSQAPASLYSLGGGGGGGGGGGYGKWSVFGREMDTFWKQRSPTSPCMFKASENALKRCV